MNKKSAPEGAPIPQDNNTTPKKKSHAEILFDKIGTGRKNAIKVHNSFYEFRKLVADANKNGDCIINTGYGYYRPSADDEAEVNHYLNRELHRAHEILDKVDAMREAYFGRY